MPTTREVVANRPLAGTELAKIIIEDVRRVLSGSGLLSGHIAYGRVSYDLRVALHFDNPAYPEATELIPSRPYPKDITDHSPELAAIEPFPLKAPSPDAYLAADSLRRDILSPNAARVENSLPVIVIRRDQNSQTHEESVLYGPEALEGQTNPNPDPVISDVTTTVKKELDIP